MHFIRPVGWWAALAALVVSLAVASAADAAGPAYSDAPSKIVNYHSGRCLEVANWSTANGAAVDQWHCYGGWSHTNQQWAFRVWGSDSPGDPNPAGQLVNVHSHKCLDDSNDNRHNGYSNLNRIQQWSCLYQANGQPKPNQMWILVASPVNGGHDFEWMNQMSRKALEINSSHQANGGIADQYSFWGGHNQIWYPVFE